MPIAPPLRPAAETGTQVLLGSGYALLLFACQLTVWGGMRLSSRSGLELLELLSWWSVPLLASIGATLLVAGALAARRRIGRAARKSGGRAGRGCVLAGCALAVAGYGILAASPAHAPLSACAGALVLGVGLGALLMAWARAFSRFDSLRATPPILAALVGSSLLCIALGPLPTAVLEGAFVVSVAAQGALLVLLEGRRRAGAGSAADEAREAGEASVRGGAGSAHARGGARAPRTARTLAKEALTALRNPIFCAAAIAFAAAITRMMTLRTRPDAGEMVGMTGAACVAAGAAVLLLALRGKAPARLPALSIPTLFRILFPLVATLLLVLSIVGEALEPLVGAVVFALYTIMAALMLPVCIETAGRRGMRAPAVYGMSAGLTYVVFSATTLLGVRLFAEGGRFDATTSLVATLLVLYVLAMAFALVQRRKSAAERPAGETAGEDAAEAPAPVACGAGARDAGDATGGNADARDAGTTRGVGAGGAQTTRIPAGAGGLGGTDAQDAESARRAGAAGAPGSSPAPAGAPEDDPIERRCLVLARERGLSPRETDVLVAFAHGRNVAYLAEQLCLSANTIRSHSKTLYTKLGIHSKQELIDLVDAVGREAE